MYCNHTCLYIYGRCVSAYLVCMFKVCAIPPCDCVTLFKGFQKSTRPDHTEECSLEVQAPRTNSLTDRRAVNKPCLRRGLSVCVRMCVCAHTHVRERGGLQASPLVTLLKYVLIYCCAPVSPCIQRHTHTQAYTFIHTEKVRHTPLGQDGEVSR